MRVVAINSSPRMDKGNTAMVLNPFLEGMREMGAEVNLFYFKKLRIEICTGCLACWYKTPGRCIFDDDMTWLLPQIAQSDVLVLAAPVYTGGINSAMQILMERTLSLVEPFFEHHDGHCRHAARQGNQYGKVVLVSTAAFYEKDNFDPLVSRVSSYSLIGRREYSGALLRPQTVLIDTTLPTDITEAAREAGHQLLRDGKMSPETLKIVSRDLVPLKQFMPVANQIIRRQFSQQSSPPAPVEPSEEARKPSTSSKPKEHILSTLYAIMQDSLPELGSEEGLHLPLLELGANSLILMQIQGAIENTFSLRIELPQFFTELTTIDALADYIGQHLPDEDAFSFAESSEPAQQPVHAAASSNSFDAGSFPSFDIPAIPPGEYSSELSQIFNQQLQIASQTLTQVVSQQLALLQDSDITVTSGAKPQVVPPSPELSKIPTTFPPGDQKVQSLPSQRGKSPEPSASLSASPHTDKKAGFTQQALSPFEIRARGLNPRQQSHLETLIARYTERTKTSKQLAQKYRQVLADSRSSVGFRFTTKEMLYLLLGKRSKGARIWDVDGNEYIDITMGFGVNLFGHHPSFIDEALKAEPQDVIQMGPRSPLVGEVAELVAELTGMQRVAFSNSGTEAVMAALRLARAISGRNKTVMFEGAYHGHSDTTMGMSKPRNGIPHTVPGAPGTPPGAVEDLIILEYGTEQSLEWINAHNHELATVIVEPIQSRNPAIQPREFLTELRTITRDTGVVLIFDEMISGFRMHPRGIQGLWGIQADIATYGKVLGGGMPIGVIAGDAKYMDGIDGGMWQYGDSSYPQATRVMFGGTFCQHPVTMTTALATLKYLKTHSPELQEGLNQRTETLVKRLNRFFKENSVPIQMSHFGSLFRFEFTQNLELFFYHMVLKGVYIWEWRNCFLSTAHTDEDIEYIVQAVKETIDEMRSGGFLPRKSMSSGESRGRDSEPITPFHDTEEEALIIPPQPLSEAQKQLAAAAQFSDEGSLAYTLCVTLRLQGAFRPAALEEAIEQVVTRHESLRTAIAGDTQHVFPSMKIEVPLIDLSGAEDPGVEGRGWIDQEIQKLFKLSEAPLFQVRILKLKENLHWLVCRAHHIVIDGMSIDIIIRELAAFYTAACTGSEVSLALPMQFREYVYWQIQQSFSSAMAAHEAYWLNKFSESVPILELPGDRQPPPIKSYRGNRITVPLNAEVCAKMNSFGQQQGCTPFMMFLSAYTILLHRLTGQDRVVVGIPAAGRTPKGSDTLVGYCTHLLVIESHLDTAQTVTEYLKAMRTILLEAYTHQDYPFANLIDKLSLLRDGSRPLLISTTFNIDQPTAAPKMFELETAWLPQPFQAAAFDLDFNITVIDGQMILECDYNTDLFESETIERFARYFQTLLAGIVSSPQERVIDLALMSEAEQRKILVEFNDTAREYSEEKTIIDLFEEQVAKTPEHVAVLHPSTGSGDAQDRQLTYRELNMLANQAAHFLRTEYQIRPDERVGLLFKKSKWMMIALLGVLKAGGAYVPIDPDYPRERINLILQDSECRAVLSEANILTQMNIAALSAKPVDIRCIPNNNSENPRFSLSPRNLAYIIYTSGSTGVPKGVMIEHRSLADYVQTVVKSFVITARDRVLQHGTYTFDASVEEFYPVLCVGGTLIVAQDSRDLPMLLEDIQRYKVSFISTSPSIVAYLNQFPEKAASLRILISGGDELKSSSVDRLYQRIATYNTYGPTETTVCATYFRISSLSNMLSIGSPIMNRQVYIVDERLKPLPVGIVGEICIAGAGVARGYLNRPELTAEKFIVNPLSSEAPPNPAFKTDNRLYRTGDLGRWLPDGTIEFFGRKDSQVKIRGYRIEPGEIEHCLLQHEAVQEAVVIAKDFRADGQKELAAYVVEMNGGAGQQAAKQDRKVTVKEFRDHIKKTLPEYMIPSYFVTLEKLPLNSSNKIDRKALPNPSEAVLERGIKYIAPRNDLERQLAQIWQNVLRLAEVGIHDNFFELGGHSLKAISIVNLVQKELGVKLSLQTVFRYPTIEEQVDHLRSQSPSTFIPITPVPEAAYYPLSHAQKRLWVLDQYEGGNSAYNMPAARILEGSLNQEAFKRSFQTLTQRHESLRTMFLTVDGEPVQEIRDWRLAIDSWGIVTYIDLTNEANAEEKAQELAREDAMKPFDLATGPLLRVSLLKLKDSPSKEPVPGSSLKDNQGLPEEDGGEIYMLLFNMHHIVTDGWSMAILIQEFCQLYEYFKQLSITSPQSTVPFPLSSLDIQYKDYVAWQKQYLESGVIDIERKYWLETLAGELPILDMPTDFPRRSLKTFAGESLEFEIGQELTQKSQKLASQYGVTLFMLFMAVYNIFLSKYTGQNDIIVGTPVAGRPHAALQHLIGMFVNLLAMRNYPKPEIRFETFLRDVKEHLLQAFAHQDYQFDHLLDDLNIKRDISRNPVFDTVFVFQNITDDEEIALTNLRVISCDVEYKISPFDFLLQAEENNHTVSMSFVYSTHLFKKPTIEDMAKHYQEILTQVVEDPGILLKEIHMTHDLLTAQSQMLQDDESDFGF